ncbi:uncharacterized protein LOC120663541 [Panicum virgatum]|uniref:uncharacterized protein LOC120663541 n=1 Tax=Panicum virgatum TaxID=38727 RepID=UPI0019D5DD84|nr:uncharacterized protein LOC120663541 [Panicum virgatum]
MALRGSAGASSDWHTRSWLDQAPLVGAAEDGERRLLTAKEHRSLLTPALALCGLWEERKGPPRGCARRGRQRTLGRAARPGRPAAGRGHRAGYENRHEECSGVRWFCERKKKVCVCRVLVNSDSVIVNYGVK